MEIQFLKCHGTGNEFILIDEYNHEYNFSEQDRKNLAINFCDSKKGIGADGILFVQKSQQCDAKMRIFNSDGSEPQMCGNGLRCVARYTCELLEKDELIIETMYEKYKVKYLKEFYEDIKAVSIDIKNISSKTSTISIDTNKKEFLFQKVEELSDSIKFSAISVSNPHLIGIVDEVDENELVRIGKMCNEGKSIFPEGINVSFVKILDNDSIYVKTFERGVGLTKSCGTGMMASSTVTCISKPDMFNKTLDVFNDGGMIKCKIQEEDKSIYRAEFSGNATYIYKGYIDVKTEDYSDFEANIQNTFDSESKMYNDFLEYTSNCN